MSSFEQLLYRKKKKLVAPDLCLGFYFANMFSWLYYVSLVDY